jgi:uncharacterized protein (TIGR02246 family)
MATTAEQEVELRELLDRWADGIARHEPAMVAALFTEEALFQGLDPTPGYGRAYVAGYYDKQPSGLTAAYELLSIRALTPDLTLAYAQVEFARPDGAVTAYLTLVAERVDGTLLLRHYHVSRVEGA